jgi:hypothetical protein
MKIEEQKKQSAAPDDLPDNARHSEGGLGSRAGVAPLADGPSGT